VLATPGAESMTIARHYFESGDWWNLRPAQDLLTEQPGIDDVRQFVAAGRTTSGDWAVVYLPIGQAIQLAADASTGISARWFDPRNGHWHDAEPSAATGGQVLFVAPDADDWVLDLRR
jgi:hypothetical protein